MIPYLEPIITPEGKVFWEGCKNKELLIPTCNSCGKAHFYPRAICPYCWSEEIQHIKASGKGKLYAYTKIYPKLPKEPYVVAIIELEEEVRLMSNILQAENQPLTVGTSVSVTFVQINESDIFIPQFIVENLSSGEGLDA